MIRKSTLAALATFALAAAAAPAAAQPVADKPAVKLDPTMGYILLSIANRGASPMTFVRRPEKADVDDYVARRGAALAKAHAKWEKKHASWVRDLEGWKKARNGPRPVEPVEPTDANLAFSTLDQEGMISIGPLNRFSKGGDRSVYLTAVRPGRYAFYGPVSPLLPTGGICLCMGTIEFDVQAGQVVDAGTVQFNLLEEAVKAKAEGRPPIRDLMDLPDDLNAVGWQVPVAGAAADPRLAAYTIVPADLRAGGRFPNYFGVQIDRITPIPGVLAYDRDRIVDLKAGAK